VFFIVCFGVRSLIEFIKEPQVEFEENMTLDMGQWLSVPFIIAGILLVIYAYKRKVPAMRVPTEKVHHTPKKKQA
jgi:prolipoprotein diacylglyceryltransferase